jgi:hypothetical protein
MFNSTMLEVAIGMVFCFAAVSLIVSQINEGISSALKLRAKGLLEGVKELLNDPKFNDLAHTLYNHALINPRGNGNAGKQEDLHAMPSYIDPAQFARAFVDHLQVLGGQGKSAAEAIKQGIAQINDNQIRGLVDGMYQRANAGVTSLEAQLASWFDQGMQRVSGGYKRWTQLISVIIGLTVAIVLNIDSVHLFEALWNRPAYTAQITHDKSYGDHSAQETFETMTKLPVGWTEEAVANWCAIFKVESCGKKARAPGWSVGMQISGWILTALSALFGAAFWFDALQHLVQLRGTGKKPEEAGAKPAAQAKSGSA